MHNIFFTDGGCIFHNIIILRNAVLRLFFYDRILRILIDDLNFAEYSISFVDAMLNALDEKELKIVEATIQAMKAAKETEDA